VLLARHTFSVCFKSDNDGTKTRVRAAPVWATADLSDLLDSFTGNTPPEPVPFTRCHTCACLRSVVAYERVGWVAPKPKPIKSVNPKPPRRETLERRLQKLESEAAQLREQLANLRTED
jgi:hypothetical protein